MRVWLKRGRVRLVSMTLGAGLLALQGCDPAVRETVLNGVGAAATSLAGTFIEAFIQSLQEDESEEATTVQADIAIAPRVFA